MKKLRVCHISTVHAPGDTRVFHRECSTLARSGYEVHLVVPGAESEKRQGVHVHGITRIHNKLLRMLLMPWVAGWRAARTRAALFHFHDPELMPIGFLLRWVLGRPVVYDVHEPVPRQILKKDYLPWWSRRALGVVYRIVEWLCTPGIQIVLANEGSLSDYPPGACVVRNYPALPTNAPKPVAVDRRPAPPMLFYVGGLAEDRGSSFHLELARVLHGRGRSFRLMMAGPAHPTYRRRLRDRVRDWQLDDVVTLRDRVSFPDAMRLAGEATIGLCLFPATPFNEVILSTKILEYMMQGTPVLASGFAHWRPYVEGTGSGRMLERFDVEHAADVAEQMLNDPAELCAMGERGRRAVRDRLNWSTELDALLRCYAGLLQ